MRFNLPILSGKGALVAIGAGLSSAIMVTAASKHLLAGGAIRLDGSMQMQQMAPMLMVFLAPLPLMITTIGFDLLGGGLAVLLGAVAFGALDVVVASPAPTGRAFAIVAGGRALGFVLTFGLPSLLLGALAIRKRASVPDIDPAPTGRWVRPEERLIGALLVAAVTYAAIVVVLAAVYIVETNGGYGSFMAELVKQIEPLLAADANGSTVNAPWIARIIIWFGALTLAAQFVCLFLINLWLAGRIAQTSSLLPIRWPDLPQNLRAPRPLAILMAVAFGLSFASGLVGLVSVIVAGALAAGFALQGLAVIHALTFGKAWRVPILLSIYFALSLLPPLLLLFAAVGLLDAAFSFRDRHQPPPDRPNPDRDRPAKGGPGPWEKTS